MTLTPPDQITAPCLDYDVYADEALLDPWPGYRLMRDAGPVVYLDRYNAFAATRYEVVRRILEDPETFPSRYGIAMNDDMNQALRGNTLCTDGAVHNAQRKTIISPLLPKNLRALKEDIAREADDLVERLVGRGDFDAATELAHHLPVTIVSNMVGLPEEGRERMLTWAEGTFNCIGPMNERTSTWFPVLNEMIDYAIHQAVPSKLKPDSWAEAVHAAAARGEVSAEAVPGMMVDYMAPSLDTTIFAISNAVWLFAEHPEQWDRIREDPSLIPSAINEVLRMESPIQDFSRYVYRDVDIDGVTLPEGSRVATFYGAGNRDERHYSEPDTFDITRNPADHLGFGAGPHTCVGMNLARLEMRLLFEALARRVRRFELGTTERALHNILRGFSRLDVSVAT